MMEKRKKKTARSAAAVTKRKVARAPRAQEPKGPVDGAQESARRLKPLTEWVEHWKIVTGAAPYRPDTAIGAGWVPVLDRLAADLVSLGWDRQIFYVKEKLGGLRVSLRTTSEPMAVRIEQAWHESYRTCELCGAAGKPFSQPRVGWVKTLCPKCIARHRTSRVCPC
jgi:hypothetical protein